MDLVRVQIVTDLIEFDVVFTSEPMDRYHADILLLELSRGPLKVRKARLVPATTEP